jgi:hypothetical protein
MVMTNRIPEIVQDWANSIANRNPKEMLSYYGRNPILLATYENLCVGREEIYEYFIMFLDKQNLECRITENFTQIDHDRDSIIASGLYNFTFNNPDGEEQLVMARYSYVINGGVIINHHSSEQMEM